MMRPAGMTCLVLLALLFAGAPARAQPGFNPVLLSKVMHLVLAPSSDYPENTPKAPGLVVVLTFLDANGAVVATTLVGGSGDAALDEKSRELVAGRRWTPLQVDGVAMGSMAILGVLWTPPGSAPPTPAEQQQLLDMMAAPPAP